MTTTQYRFEVRNADDDVWHETTESYVCERLRRDDPAAGTDNRGQTIRKVGIRPDAWTWQTTRYASGNHDVWTEADVIRYPELYRMNDPA